MNAVTFNDYWLVEVTASNNGEGLVRGVVHAHPTRYSQGYIDGHPVRILTVPQGAVCFLDASSSVIEMLEYAGKTFWVVPDEAMRVVFTEEKTNE